MNYNSYDNWKLAIPSEGKPIDWTRKCQACYEWVYKVVKLGVKWYILNEDSMVCEGCKEEINKENHNE